MDAGEWIESFVRGFMCLLGIVGNNWLAIRFIPKKMSQIRTNEVLFLNLAISNLITNYFVDLPDTMADFADKWFMGRAYCAIFQFCSDLSETSSIVSTLLISVYWHQKLVGALRRGTAPVRLDNLRLVAALLAGGWAIALVFSIPHFFFVSLDTGNETSDDCEEKFPSPVARQIYEAMYLTLANAVPITGMVVSSLQIVITLLRHQARVKAMNSETHSSATNAPATKGAEPEARSGQGTDGTDTQVAAPAEAPGSSAPCNTQPQSSGVALSAPESSKDVSSSNSVAPVPNQTQSPKETTSPKPVKAAAGQGNQVRAAKSVVAVASVFLVCWLTHLLLRITSNVVNQSSVVVEVASYIAASYTCIIPYIFLHGVRKLSCSCIR